MSEYLHQKIRRPVPQQLSHLCQSHVIPNTCPTIRIIEGTVVAHTPRRGRMPDLYTVEYQSADGGSGGGSGSGSGNDNGNGISHFTERLTESEIKLGLTYMEKRLTSCLTVTTLDVERERIVQWNAVLQERRDMGMEIKVSHEVVWKLYVVAAMEMEYEQRVREKVALIKAREAKEASAAESASASSSRKRGAGSGSGVGSCMRYYREHPTSYLGGQYIPPHQKEEELKVSSHEGSVAFVPNTVAQRMRTGIQRACDYYQSVNPSSIHTNGNGHAYGGNGNGNDAGIEGGRGGSRRSSSRIASTATPILRPNILEVGGCVALTLLKIFQDMEEDQQIGSAGEMKHTKKGEETQDDEEEGRMDVDDDAADDANANANTEEEDIFNPFFKPSAQSMCHHLLRNGHKCTSASDIQTAICYAMEDSIPMTLPLMNLTHFGSSGSNDAGNSGDDDDDDEHSDYNDDEEYNSKNRNDGSEELIAQSADKTKKVTIVCTSGERLKELQKAETNVFGRCKFQLLVEDVIPDDDEVEDGGGDENTQGQAEAIVSSSTSSVSALDSKQQSLIEFRIEEKAWRARKHFETWRYQSVMGGKTMWPSWNEYVSNTLVSMNSQSQSQSQNMAKEEAEAKKESKSKTEEEAKAGATTHLDKDAEMQSAVVKTKREGGDTKPDTAGAGDGDGASSGTEIQTKDGASDSIMADADIAAAETSTETETSTAPPLPIPISSVEPAETQTQEAQDLALAQAMVTSEQPTGNGTSRRSRSRRATRGGGDAGDGPIFYGANQSLTAAQIMDTVHRIIMQAGASESADADTSGTGIAASKPKGMALLELKKLILGEGERSGNTPITELKKIRVALGKLTFRVGKVQKMLVNLKSDQICWDILLGGGSGSGSGALSSLVTMTYVPPLSSSSFAPIKSASTTTKVIEQKKEEKQEEEKSMEDDSNNNVTDDKSESENAGVKSDPASVVAASPSTANGISTIGATTDAKTTAAASVEENEDSPGSSTSPSSQTNVKSEETSNNSSGDAIISDMKKEENETCGESATDAVMEEKEEVSKEQQENDTTAASASASASTSELVSTSEDEVQKREVASLESYVRTLHATELALRGLLLKHNYKSALGSSASASTFQQVTPSLLAMAADEKENDPEGHDRHHFYEGKDEDGSGSGNGNGNLVKQNIAWTTTPNHPLIGKVVYRPSTVNEDKLLYVDPSVPSCHWYKVVSYVPSIASEEPSETTTNTSNETNENTVGRRARFRAEAISSPSSASSSSMSQSQEANGSGAGAESSKPWVLLTESQVHAGINSANLYKGLKRDCTPLSRNRSHPFQAMAGMRFLLFKENNDGSDSENGTEESKSPIQGLIAGHETVSRSNSDRDVDFRVLIYPEGTSMSSFWATLSEDSSRITVSESESCVSYRLEPQEYHQSSPAYEACESVLTYLKSNVKVVPFLDPVDPIALNIPDYFDTIKEPMDLSTVERNLVEGKYGRIPPGGIYNSTVSKMLHGPFHDDIMLTFDNAMLYNPKGDWIHDDASVLKGLASKKINTIANKAERLHACYAEETPSRSRKTSIYVDENSDVDMYEYESDYDDEFTSTSTNRNKKKRSRSSKSARVEDYATRVIETPISVPHFPDSPLISSLPLCTDERHFALPQEWTCEKAEIKKEQIKDNKCSQSTAATMQEEKELLMLHAQMSVQREVSRPSTRRSSRPANANSSQRSGDSEDLSSALKGVQFVLQNDDVLAAGALHSSLTSIASNRSQVEAIRETLHEEYYAKLYYNYCSNHSTSHILQESMGDNGIGIYSEGSFPPYLGRIIPSMNGNSKMRTDVTWEIKKEFVVPALRWVLRGLVNSNHLSEWEEFSLSTYDSETLLLANHAYYYDKSKSPFAILDRRKKLGAVGPDEEEEEEEVELSAYEKMRAERVARNKEKLKALGLA